MGKSIHNGRRFCLSARASRVFSVVAIGAAFGVMADLSWPSNFADAVAARQSSVLPTGTVGEEEMFDTKGTVGYSSAACGDAVNAFDTVVAVVRNTTGHDLTTIPGALCIIFR